MPIRIEEFPMPEDSTKKSALRICGLDTRDIEKLQSFFDDAALHSEYEYDYIHRENVLTIWTNKEDVHQMLILP